MSAPRVICPHCDGATDRQALVCGTRDGERFAEVRAMQCVTCEGAGTVTEDHVERIRQGKQLHDDRVAKRIGIREVAWQARVDPADVSKVERGRGNPQTWRLQYQRLRKVVDTTEMPRGT